MGESINLVNSFKVNNVIFNQDEYNDLELELISLLKRKQIFYTKTAQKLKVGQGQFYFLNTRIYDNENDNSNVVYVKIYDKKILLMGDAGIEKEKDILDKYHLNHIDVLKVGHHGSDTSSSKSFIERIQPKYSLISVGKNNRYGHPKNSVLDILSDSKVVRTDLDGSIILNIKKNKLAIETCIP